MIEGSRWRRWLFVNIPIILFVFVLLFPFYWMIITTVRPDAELFGGAVRALMLCGHPCLGRLLDQLLADRVDSLVEKSHGPRTVGAAHLASLQLVEQVVEGLHVCPSGNRLAPE